MYPFCLALLVACMARPVYVQPPYLQPPIMPGTLLQGPGRPGPGPRPPPTIYVPMPHPPELAADDPRIAPAPKQYYEPAPDRVWGKPRSMKYDCPGSKDYGRGRGVYLTEPDATMSGLHPVAGRACFRVDGARQPRHSAG